MIRGEDYTAMFFAFYDNAEGDNEIGDPAPGVKETITCEIKIDSGTKEVLDIELTDEGAGYYSLIIPHERFSIGSRGSLFSTSSNANITVIPWQNDTTINDGAAEPTATSSTYGPKRVKTKEIEIEAHDPLKLQRLVERTSTKPITLGQFPRTYVVPKYPNPVCPNDFRYDPNDHNLLD